MNPGPQKSTQKNTPPSVAAESAEPVQPANGEESDLTSEFLISWCWNFAAVARIISVFLEKCDGT